MTEPLFFAMLEERDPERPYFQAYWAEGRHLGEAIDRIGRAARAAGLRHPMVRAADPRRSMPARRALGVASGGRVFWRRERHEYPAAETPSMALPRGVVVSAEQPEGASDPDEIQPGYSVRTRAGLRHLVVSAPAERLLADYLALLGALEPFAVFWIKIHGHWQGEPDDRLYVARRLKRAAAIARYLREDPANTVEQGFVTLTAYVRDGATNVSLSDHKLIEVLTTSPSMLARAVAVVRELGYRRPRRLVTVHEGIAHWHYRPPRSLDRAPLVRKLLRQGFALWQPGA